MKTQLGRRFISELYAGVAAGAFCITLLPQKQSIWLDASEKAQPNGEVSGTVTWQYNDFVGTRGDVGAKVYLVPHPVEQTLKELKLESDGLYLEGAMSIYGSRVGILKATADGYGKYMISNVNQGLYDVIVISKNVKAYPNSSYNKNCVSKFGLYGETSGFKFKKAACGSVFVTAGDTSTYSHDFGNSER